MLQFNQTDRYYFIRKYIIARARGHRGGLDGEDTVREANKAFDEMVRLVNQSK